MNDSVTKLKNLIKDIEKAKQFFLDHINRNEAVVHIFTHLDADGLTAGAILGKALYREGIPFQISVIRQLEREEIVKIASRIKEFRNFIFFCDFGSGQYLELQDKLRINGNMAPFIVLDHHLPQDINNKEEIKEIEEIRKKTSPWHVNPYFYGINGSEEISGAGMVYYFARSLNERNIDLSSIALIGATGDVQNKGKHKAFTGINSLILDAAKKEGLIEVVDDLNFSSIRPLNEAIAFSSDIKLPGLTGEANKTLKFLQTIGVFMENSEGEIRTLSELSQDDKQKVSSAIIEYATIKLNIEPAEIVKKLIVNHYLLTKESKRSLLYDVNEFSRVLNACGRTNNGSLGIAVAMGDRKKSFELAKENLKNYKRSLGKSLTWIYEEKKCNKRITFNTS